MTDKKKLFEKTKVNVVSCVLPEKGGVPLTDLNRVFHNYIGNNIPHLKLGYGSLQSLLEDMSDRIELVQDSDKIMVRAAVMENTRHLSEMVAKQKGNDNKNKYAQRGFARNAHNHQAYRIAKTVVVPAKIQEMCLEVLKRNRNGLRAEWFSEEYKKFHNQELKFWSYGFPSLEACCMSMSRVFDVKMDQRGFIFLPTDEYIKGWEKEDRARERNRDRLLNDPSGAKAMPSETGSGSQVIPERVKDNLRRMMLSPVVSSSGINLYHLQQNYQKHFNERLEPKEFGFATVAAFCQCLSDIFDLRFMNVQGQKIHKLFPAETLKSPPGSVDRSVSQAPTHSAEIIGTIKNNILCLLRQLGTATIPLDDLWDKYLDHFKDELDVSHQGITIEDLLEEMVDDNLIEFSSPEPFVEHSDRANWLLGLSSHQRELLERQLSPKSFRSCGAGAKSNLIPRGVKLPLQNISETHDEFIDVFIGEIISPSKFYVRLIREDCSGALVNLEIEMANFYSRCGQERDQMLRITPADVSPNDLVAVRKSMDGVPWHRALVRRLVQPSGIEVEVEVFFVDTGCKTNVKISDLRRLTQPFVRLPAQAIEARCANIEPKCLTCAEDPRKCLKCSPVGSGLKRPWSPAAKKCFATLINEAGDKGLVARYLGLQRSLVERISLILIDTASNDFEGGININEELIKRDHAIAQSESRNNTDSLRIAANLAKSGRFNDVIKNPSIRMPVFEGKEDEKKLSLDISEFKALSSIEDHINKPGSSVRSVQSVATCVNSHPNRSHRSGGHKGGQLGGRPMGPLDARFSSISKEDQSKSAQRSEVRCDPPDIVPLQQTKHKEIEEENVAINPVNLTNKHRLNVVRVSGVAYVTTAEISAFFPRWKGQDLLTKMLKMKGGKFPSLTLHLKDHEWFFEKCLIENVGGIETPDGEDVMQKITLFQLEYVPNIYRLLGGQSVDTELLGALESLAP